ncbi:single-stranded DNA-binding protein [Gemmatimonadota bacterium]
MGRGSVNKVIVLGNLGQDPEVKSTQGGQMLARLRVATNRTWTGKDGQRQEETEWHTIVAWGRLAEIIEQYLKKGDQAYFEGRLQTRSWEDKSGEKRYSTEIVAQEMQMLGSGGGGGGGGGRGGFGGDQAGNGHAGSGGGGSGVVEPEDDDLPF